MEKIKKCVKNNENTINRRRNMVLEKGTSSQDGYKKDNEVGNKDCGEIEKDQWKCGKCGLLQSFDFIECSDCGESREVNGVWRCDKCTMINKCGNVRCGACEIQNDHLKIKYCKYCKKNKVRVNEDKCGECRANNYNMKMKEDTINKKENKVLVKRTSSQDGYKKEYEVGKILNKDCGKIEKDQWKCGKCGLLQSFDFIQCSVCGESREVNGVWRCDKCTMINKCDNVRCGACEGENDLLEVKHEINNIINKVNVNDLENNVGVTIKANKFKEIKWTCSYNGCGEKNAENEIYCGICKIERNFSRVRGNTVKMLINHEERIIWICHKCFTINELSEYICKCGEMRYKKKYCKSCQLYTDGRSDKCGKCDERV